MKLFVVIMSVVVVWVAGTHGADTELDIEAVVANIDTLKAVYGCFVSTSPCNERQTRFKDAAPKAIKEACANCKPEVKHNLNRFLTAMKEKLPESYIDLKKHYDPENKYIDALEAAIASF